MNEVILVSDKGRKQSFPIAVAEKQLKKTKKVWHLPADSPYKFDGRIISTKRKEEKKEEKKEL